MVVVPPPTLESVTPETICVDQQDVTLTFMGSGFLNVDGTLPTVTFAAGDQEWTFTPEELTECAGLPAPAESD